MNTGGIVRYFNNNDGSKTTHGDIGTDRRNNNAFKWMVSRAEAAGLKFHPHPEHLNIY